MSEVIKKLALQLVVLGFYPLVYLLGKVGPNIPAPGPDIPISLLELIWAIALAISMLISYKEFKR